MAEKSLGSTQAASLSPLQWMPVQGAEGPQLRNHSGMCLGNYLYIHGGVISEEKSGRGVLNGFYRIQISPTVGQWVDMTTANSPSLSQHACFEIRNRYIAFVGGWTGQARIPGVHTYDTESDRWLPAALSEPLLKGFPSGAGLSAHTITTMRPGGQKHLSTALIIGREGSLRTQRKAGSLYLLHADFPSMQQSDGAIRYTYYEVNSLSASSRSYHTTTAISPSTVVTIGGRSDHPVESISWSHHKGNSQSDWPGSLHYPPRRSPLVSDLVRKVRSSRVTVPSLPSSTRSCWRGHAAIPGDGGILITSGEGFNALVRDPLDSAYLFLSNATGTSGILHSIGKLKHPRAYAVTGLNENDGTAWLHGGVGPRGVTQHTLLRLQELTSTDESE